MLHTSAHLRFRPPIPGKDTVKSVAAIGNRDLQDIQLVIRSATPADSWKNVSALALSKNSMQNLFISMRPLRMTAAIAYSVLGYGSLLLAFELTLRVVSPLQPIHEAGSDSNDV